MRKKAILCLLVVGCLILSGCGSKSSLKHLDTRINDACSNASSSDISKLKSLISECNALSKEQIEQLENYNLLNQTYKRCVDKCVDEICNLAKGLNLEDAQTKLLLNSADFSRDQIDNCLTEIGRWNVFKMCEDALKKSCKNPYTYQRYSGKTSFNSSKGQISSSTGSYHSVHVEIEFGAQNAFGAMIRGIQTFDGSFETQIDSLSVKYGKLFANEF